MEEEGTAMAEERFPWQPLGSRVVIRPVEQESRTPSGLIIPETAKEKPQVGIVVAVGDDESIRVRVGDRVLFPKYSGNEVKVNGVEYLILDANDLLAYDTETRATLPEPKPTRKGRRKA
jgi:chaperonin GroES